MSTFKTVLLASESCPALSISKLEASVPPSSEYVRVSPSASVAVTGNPKTPPPAVDSYTSMVNESAPKSGASATATAL